MKNTILIGLLALAPLTAEANGYRYPSTNPGYSTSAGYYGNYSSQYNSYHHQYRHYKNNNNEWKYALGGLIVGTIIANQNQKRVEQPTYSQPLPPPQKRKVQTCYDEVAYDSAGQPYVARQCYDTWQ